MSASVDVLAVMEAHSQIRADAIVAAEVKSRPQAEIDRRTAKLDEAIEARAAVAELIEESRAVLSVMHAAGLNDAALRAALARIGGAQ